MDATFQAVYHFVSDLFLLVRRTDVWTAKRSVATTSGRDSKARVVSRTLRLARLAAVLAVLSTVMQPSFAQAPDPPLNFGNNFFVTGDYLVAGAYNMTTNFSNGYAVGTINVPDTKNKGITGATSVPPGAEVIAAVLYWQTVEKVGVVPGQPGSGQNGYFRPVFAGGPKSPGYPITGVDLNAATTVSWSSGGCTGSSTGKVLRTYRANVIAALPHDPSGNIIVNGMLNGITYGTFEVRLPSVGNSTPLTLGASLVIIYRVLSPNTPLNSIVIYDGNYAAGNATLTMTQTLQGFYQAAQNPVSRLTHIVGGGKSNKLQTVYLDNIPLPSLYSQSGPAFPGWYGSWDNPTWTFTNPSTNPVHANDASATTSVVPSTSNQGCVSWGAVIVSTTVQNSDGDGLLDVWKKPPNPNRPGYCDASVNEGVCNPGDPSWVDLPGAKQNEKDVFVQLDYMCSNAAGGDSCTTGDGVNYSFDPRPSGAIDMVVGPGGPFMNKNIHVHVNPAGTNQPNVHAIQEQSCTDNFSVNPPALCPFPNQPGVVAWKNGFDFIKNQLIDPDDPLNLGDCTTSPPAPDCVARFQPGKRYSWHYALFAHAAGQPKWTWASGTLKSVAQSANTVTFTTSAPVSTLRGTDAQGNLLPDPCPSGLGRVTVFGAATNVNLNGTFCVTGMSPPNGFTIQVGGNSLTGSFTVYTDPNLAIAPGYTSTASGVSDVGGADSLITLGLWGNPALPTSDGQKKPVIGGTFMHEFGHGLGLTHGGFSFAAGSYVPTLGPNCKTNYQSVMSYSAQVDLLTPVTGGPNVPDYSEQSLTSLSKSTGGSALSGTQFLNTTWYVPYPAARDANGNPIGSPAKTHCDGTQINDGALMTRVTGPATSFAFAAGQDINFDGNTSETLTGYNDWLNVDYRQIGATGTGSTAEGGGQQFGGGGQQFGGGGQQFGGGGQQFGGGGQQFGGGGQQFGGGGQQFGGGGQQFGGGGAELDVATVNSITRPPQNLAATEESSPRYIDLSWTAPAFGQIGAYRVYRSSNGGATFTLLNTVPGTQLTYQDTSDTCNAQYGYQYFVTAVLAGTFPSFPPPAGTGQESVPSNTAPASGPKLTGCYTNTPPSVSLTSLTVGGPNPVVQGTSVPITWTLQDDDTGAVVTNKTANSLVAIGPIANDAGCGPVLPTTPTTTLLANGTVTASNPASVFGLNGSTFTFNWDTTPFNAGCYLFTLTFDSTQTESTTTPLTVLIYVSDTAPYVTTTSLPDAHVGVNYSNTIYQAGGVGPFGWTIASGTLPAGITLNAGSGLLSGSPTTPGTYAFQVKVTDSVGNFGTQNLTLRVIPPVPQVNQPSVPDTSVPGAGVPQLTLNGTGFVPNSVVLWNGAALTTTFVSSTQVTATVPSGLVASTASISVSSPLAPNSNIDFFPINYGTATVSLGRALPDLAVGVNPNGVIVADLNGDGKQDLAITNSGGGTVSILLGNGDGTFTAKPLLTAGNYPYSVIVGDFNGDGRLDLAVANANFNNGPGTISVFLGNGDGTFQAPASFTAGNAPTSVITGDFNRDGKLDLAVANQNDHSVSILLGNGDGTFQTHVDYQAGTTDAAEVALGDFNGDGKLDLAVTNPSSDTVSVLLGNGDGTFKAAVPYSTGNSGDHPIAVGVADFNGDGVLDLAVTNLNVNKVAILLGNGDGTFKAPVPYSTTTGAFIGPSAITTGDFNADGELDLAVTDQHDNTVSILLGNGDGTFGSPVEFGTGNLASGVAAGDFNADGRLDIAVANFTDGTVSIMLQRPQPATGLATSSVVTGSVSLTWFPSVSPDVVGYNVYRAITSGGPYTKLNSSVVSGTGYSDMTVASGTTYYYVVTAVSAANVESVYSNEVSAVVP